MIRKIFIILAVLFSASIFAEIFTILEESENHLIIEFNLPDYEISETQNIICKNSFGITENGYPQLPFFNETIGLPIDGDLTISILENQQQNLQNIQLSPFQNELNTENSQPSNSSKMNFAIFPKKIIEKKSSAFIGDRKFCGINIFPFRYKPKMNELIVSQKIIFKVNISGDKSTTRNHFSNNFIDEVSDDFFLNNKFSKNWRLKRNTAEYQPPRNENIINEIQIIVNEEGIYRVSFTDLFELTSNFNDSLHFAFEWENINPKKLELFDENGVVPLHFVGENDNTFDEDDYFEFWGTPHLGDEQYMDDYTAENVYILRLSDNFGSRMAVENGGLINLDPDDFTVPQSFQQTIHFEQQNIAAILSVQWDHTDHNYFREDIWFWDKLNAPTLERYPFEIQYPHQSAIRNLNAKICLFGTSYLEDDPDTEDIDEYEDIDNHRAQVHINSSLINQMDWWGQNEQIFENTNTIQNLNLNHGLNDLYIGAPGIPGINAEQQTFDYFDLTYWREYKTDENFIRFSKPQNKPLDLYQFEIDGFSNDDISIYKLGCSVFENLQIEPFFEGDGAPFKVSFQDSIFSQNTEYYAVTNDQKKSPKFIRVNTPSNLKSPSNSAEYVVITIQDFTANEHLLNFKNFWESRGINTKIIALQNIFDEFNHGIRSAQAIRDFLQYAYNNWNYPQLSHVLLLGDGITDERDDSSNRPYNLIPFKNIWESGRGVVPSDNWFGCIVGDDYVPDISISRINIWNESQIEGVVNKTIHHVNNPNYDDLWHSKIIMAAGGKPSEGIYFAEQSERVIDEMIPPEFSVKRIYCNTNGLPSGYAGNTLSLLNSINNGASYVQFLGHGSGYVWADYNLLNFNDIVTLNNVNYPFVASLSCNGSSFNQPQSTSIGEKLIITPEKGAIAHFGFTGYGYKSQNEFFSKMLTESIFQSNLQSVGKMVDLTKAKFYSAYGSEYFATKAFVDAGALFGDPMVPIVRPAEKRDITINKYNFSEGDTLQILIEVGPNITKGKFVIFDEDDVQLPLNQYYPFEIVAENDTIKLNSFVVPESANLIYTDYIKFYGFGEDFEVNGITNFTVGKTAVINLEILPENPTATDSVHIQADFFDEDEIDYIILKLYPFFDDYEMTNIDGAKYKTTNPLPTVNSGSKTTFHFEIFDINGDSTHSKNYNYTTIGADLSLQIMELIEHENQPTIKLFIKNKGTDIAEFCQIKLEFLNTELEPILADFTPLPELEERWSYISLPSEALSDTVEIRAVVNENAEFFPEIATLNNELTKTFNLNYFQIGNSAATISSLDGNVDCIFPEHFAPNSVFFYLNNLGIKEAINQPDIQNVLLANDNYSTAYEIGVIDELFLADSLGHFPNNQEITLIFHFNPNDTLQQINTTDFDLYCWQNDFEKWVYAAPTIVSGDSIEAKIDRIGIYTILQNNDHTSPYIEANVEGQEFSQSNISEDFTFGGYISRTGTISFLLSDENGINVFDESLKLFLSDEFDVVEIEKENYSISATYGNLINIPIKYTLNNLASGNYVITIDCSDVNNNAKTLGIEFQINEEFNVLNFANYPNPIKTQTTNYCNSGRTRFTYVLTDNADNVSIKIYTVSGRLVKTLGNLPTAVGYHEFPRTVYGWDCTDNEGHYLANGVYFYRITAKKGNDVVEKIEKMAILK